MAVKKRGTGARSQAVKKAALAKETKARKEYVRKKNAEGSAVGIFAKNDAKSKAKRAAARKQAKQAGGDGRIGGGSKRVTPRKLKKAPRKGR